MGDIRGSQFFQVAQFLSNLSSMRGNVVAMDLWTHLVVAVSLSVV
jgi:hypothetical protein